MTNPSAFKRVTNIFGRWVEHVSDASAVFFGLVPTSRSGSLIFVDLA